MVISQMILSFQKKVRQNQKPPFLHYPKSGQLAEQRLLDENKVSYCDNFWVSFLTCIDSRADQYYKKSRVTWKSYPCVYVKESVLGSCPSKIFDGAMVDNHKALCTRKSHDQHNVNEAMNNSQVILIN